MPTFIFPADGRYDGGGFSLVLEGPRYDATGSYQGTDELLDQISR